MSQMQVRKLTELLRPSFTAASVTNGNARFARGQVSLSHATTRCVTATVSCEGHNHDTGLFADEDLDLICSCDCSYAKRQVEPCDHIWALLRAADDKGFLNILHTANPGVYVVNDLTEFASVSATRRPQPPPQPPPTPPPDWRQGLSRLKLITARRINTYGRPERVRLAFSLDLKAENAGSPSYAPALELYDTNHRLTVSVYKAADASASDTSFVPYTWDAEAIHTIPEENDRAALALLTTLQPATPSYSSLYAPSFRSRPTFGPSFDVPPSASANILKTLLSTNRCCLKSGGALIPISVDDEVTWSLRLKISRRGNRYLLHGVLTDGNGSATLPSEHHFMRGGIILDTKALNARRLNEEASHSWFTALQTGKPLSVPRSQVWELMEELLTADGNPPLDLPEELLYTEVHPDLKPRIAVRQPRGDEDSSRLFADLTFAYDGVIFPGRGGRKTTFTQARPPSLVHRNPDAERAALRRLDELGFRPAPKRIGESAYSILAKKFPSAAQALTSESWHVESDGKPYRAPSGVKISVTSGVDWFDVNGSVSFGDASSTAELPELLQAAKRGERVVALDDGSFGLLPDEWLRRYGLLTDMSIPGQGSSLRFRRNQAALLDALLASKEGATFDDNFERARAEVKSFSKIKPANAPKGFAGKLRPYQREGLGWLLFLQKFGFGGCLADDMGLGKTPTTLALLEGRRAGAGDSGGGANPPSLVIAPKTAVPNWRKEAARFTPGMRVLVHTGSDRLKPEEFGNYDLILTSFGTARQDATDLKDFEFDYVVIDEAQAIKNSSTQAAKAARLLNARHRLALTGTPVENHLSDLWSIFEFINPGMLGRSKIFDRASKVEPGPEELRTLSQALRPFILRRLKTQKDIARTLPPKTEQTLYCELPPHQRKKYDELRNYYRGAILRRLDEDGVNRSKIHVLAALTRLRQAACHLGLIDENKTVQTCGKFDALFDVIDGISGDGHKCLIFSQFKSFLKILAARLDRHSIPYCYMDGDTSGRERERVEEDFKTDPNKRLFLISLKTGGTALNLQAADYVFILDPWWNPKPEAQAIDRAHRDGQTQHVFAYKLIARDTIEEKVLELQEKKSALADSVITEENGFISKMTRKEIELLFE